MKETTAREKVLKKVRNALINKASSPASTSNIDFDSPVYVPIVEAPEIHFAQKFTSLTGKFAFCEDYDELLALLDELVKEKELGDIFCNEAGINALFSKSSLSFTSDLNALAHAKATVTFCEALVARTGSILVSSRQVSGRRGPVAPDVHIVVAYTSQLVEDIKDGLNLVKDRYGDKPPSMVSLITGPSRTADIEKTLVLGAHGPKEVYLFLLDDTLVNRI